MRPTRALRACIALATLAVAASCGSNRPVFLALAGNATCDPFVQGGATHARLTLQGAGGGTQTVPVAADGSFHFTLTPPMISSPGRVLVEALRNGDVVGTGATPYATWTALVNQRLTVQMHCRRQLLRSPTSLQTPRADFELLPYGATGPIIVTSPPGATAAQLPEGIDLFTNTSANVPSYTLPAVLDGDTSVLLAANGDARELILLHGADNYVWPPTSGSSSTTPYTDSSLPRDRTSLVGAATMGAPQGGGYLLGGRSGTQRSTRVDHMSQLGVFDATLPPALQTARARAALVELQALSDSVPEILLLLGGQAPGDPPMELYRSSSAGSPPMSLRSVLGDELGQRTDAAAVCTLTEDSGACARVLLLGGRTAAGALAPDDVLLDGTCLRSRATSPTDQCNPVLRRGTWLTTRRFGARAALAEGFDVVVAGGRTLDSGGIAQPVLTVDVVDASSSDMPVSAGAVGTLLAADPALRTMPNGSVMIAGGTHVADGSPDSSLWFYRR